MTMAFGFMNAALAVVIDKERGVTDRFRSMPMSPSAVVTGRGVPDVLHAGLDLAMLAAIALLIGWRSDGGPLATAAAFGRCSCCASRLGAIAMSNPVSSTAYAIHELFGNPVPTGGSWIEDNAILMAVA